MVRKTAVFICVAAGLMVIGGCAHWQKVTYSDVKPENTARILLVSGEAVQGTVKKIEPHQIIVQQPDKILRISKTSVNSIKIAPPVYDDFGRCISEQEIKSVKTNKNAVIYGIGGGALSFGSSFFLGSMLAGEDTSKSSTTLLGTTAAGTGIGTLLFVRAGMAKDRNDAIEKIRETRREKSLKKNNEDTSEQKNLQKMIESEKARQEKLQKEREELLKKLQQKKKK